MRAMQITELSGPASALKLVDVPEPEPSHPMTPGSGVIVEVHAAGAAFPDALLTRGLYQYKPDPPFVLGAEIAGVVRSAPDDAHVRPGDRVVGLTMLTGGMAEVAVLAPDRVFKLPDNVSFTAGAGLLFNDLTVYFALTVRGRLHEGETVLVPGAAGGIGTSALITRTSRDAVDAGEAESAESAASGPDGAGCDQAGCAAVMSAMLTSWFAPGATVIMFSPAWSTVIIAIPVGAPATIRTRLSSISSARSASRSVRPNRSPLSRPRNVVSTPSLPSVRAVLKGPPPGRATTAPASSTTRSISASPMTAITSRAPSRLACLQSYHRATRPSSR